MKMSAWAQAHFERLEHDPEFLAARMMIEINEQIVARMSELNVSQRELARRLGKTQPYISRLLNRGTNATIVTLAAIANALDAEWEAPRLNARKAESLPADTTLPPAQSGDSAPKRNGRSKKTA